MAKPLGIILATTEEQFESQLLAAAPRMAKDLKIPLQEAKTYWIHCQAGPKGIMTFADKWRDIPKLAALREQDVILFISAHGESIGHPTNGAENFSCFRSGEEDIVRVSAENFVTCLQPYIENFNSLSCVLDSCQAAAPAFGDSGNEMFNLQERLHLAAQQHTRVNFVTAHKNLVAITIDGSWLLIKPGEDDITEHENTLVKYNSTGLLTETYEHLKSKLLAKPSKAQCDVLIKTVICDFVSGVLEPSAYDEFVTSLDGITNGDMIAKLTATVAAIYAKIPEVLEKYHSSHIAPVVGTSVVTHSHAGELLHFDWVTQQQALGDFQAAVYSKMHEVLASVGGTAKVSTPEEIAVSNLFELVYSATLPVGTADAMQAQLERELDSLSEELQNMVDAVRELEQSYGCIEKQPQQHLEKLVEHYQTHFDEIKQQRAQLPSQTTHPSMSAEEKEFFAMYHDRLARVTTPEQLLTLDIIYAAYATFGDESFTLPGDFTKSLALDENPLLILRNFLLSADVDKFTDAHLIAKRSPEERQAAAETASTATVGYTARS